MKAPLKFTPLLKTRVWGGDILKARAHGASEEPIGESWEISDHDVDSTVICGGEFDGQSLHEVFERNTEALCGKAVDPASPGVFPLMLKLIDPRQDLSVQVHPNDEYAGRQKAGELGKSEAWYVLEADAGGKLYRGLKPGVTKELFSQALADGEVAEVLNGFEVKPGDVVNIPAGTIHALGSGVRIAEIQQNSDTTYRVFDWNRVGLDGKPRELHVEHALAVSNFDENAPDTCMPVPLETSGCLHERFVDCEKFRFERLSQFSGDVPLDTMGNSFHILTVASGKVEVVAEEGGCVCGKWDTCLLPAAAGKYTLRAAPETVALLFYRP